ncbi:MAG: hypothetical protein JOZ15_06710 [Acidobacteria bacterium]|nr:hypothetical protein [Acidobacteriota bacterium]
MNDDAAVAGQADAPISLQLDRAEFEKREGERCVSCGQPLGSSYYQINGRICCASCHDKLAARLAQRPGAGGLARAAGAGLAAAVAGAGIFFAVRAATGYEFGLISILVGYMVGRAVRWGARGQGGWACQTLAVLLTYLAIVLTYVPLIITAATKAYHPAATTAAPASAGQAPDASPAGSRQLAGPAAAAERHRRPSLGEFLGAWSIILGIAAIVPFTGSINPIGLFIIAIGLFEAWKLTRQPRVAIDGPFTVKAAGWHS